MKILILGDVVAEVIGRVDRRFTEIDRDVLLDGPVECRVGGTAANLALAARDYFDDVLVTGVVGDDPIADVLELGLHRAGIRTRLLRKADAPSGMTIYLRDAGRTGGVRLLVVGRPSALPLFDTADAESLRLEVAGADFLVVDGYASRSSARREATLRLMAWGREDGTQVVYDVVPHDCFRWQTADELRRLTSDASVIVVEARTLNAFVGLPWTDGDADWGAACRAEEAGRRMFPNRRILIRFGAGNIDETLLVRPGRPADRYATGYAVADDPRGFGDRLLARELGTLLAGTGD